MFFQYQRSWASMINRTYLYSRRSAARAIISYLCIPKEAELLRDLLIGRLCPRFIFLDSLKCYLRFQSRKVISNAPSPPYTWIREAPSTGVLPLVLGLISFPKFKIIYKLNDILKLNLPFKFSILIDSFRQI
jgi:hypothetical protein